MIKKLRRQFICIAMLSMALVLFAIIGGINIVHYVNVKQNLDYKLELIAANDGSFPDLSIFLEDTTEQTDLSENQDSESRETDPGAGRERKGEGEVPPEKPQGGNNETGGEDTLAKEETLKLPVVPEGDTDILKKRGISQESSYSTRYFTVTLDVSGSLIDTNTAQIASVSEEKAADFAETLWQKGRLSGNGYFKTYRYLAVENTNDAGKTTVLYIFMDCTQELQNARLFLAVSVLVSLFGLLLVFVLVLFFSKLIVKPMAESYEKQKRFITDASHELKTPLTIIDANTEIMEMMEGENEWTAGIRKQTRRLASLTEKLVFLSRMDEEATKPQMLDFPLSDVVKDVAEGFLTIAEAKGKTMELSVEEGLSYCGDEKMIRQLLSLLLDNAMKYSDEHGSILLTLKSTGKGRQLIVANSVEEIEPGDHPELFERFYRRDSSHNSKTGGFGIGLSVVWAIVQAHKGKITARSKDERSLEFFIELP